MRVSDWRLYSSKASAGKTGRRSSSATSATASARCSRRVLRLTLTPPAPGWMAICVFSASSRSCTCWRDSVAVPLSSSRPTASAAAAWPNSVFSSPKRRLSTACAAAPRVGLASTAAFSPPNSKRCVRASMLAGVASKASTAAAAACGLNCCSTCATSTLAGRRRALRRVGGDVAAERAVRRAQVGLGHALHVGQRDLAHLVAAQEEQPPVAQRDGLGQRQPDVLGVGEVLLPAVEPLRARALQLVGGDRRLGDRLGSPRAARCAPCPCPGRARARRRRTSPPGRPATRRRRRCWRPAAFRSAACAAGPKARRRAPAPASRRQQSPACEPAGTW